MTKTIAAVPVALALALSLAACGRSDTGGNAAVANDVLLNDALSDDGGLTTGNAAGDNVVLSEEGLGDNAVALNGSADGLNEAAPATNGQ